MVRLVVGVVALVFALLTHFLGAAWTFFHTCRISDTADLTGPLWLSVLAGRARRARRHLLGRDAPRPAEVGVQHRGQRIASPRLALSDAARRVTS